MIAMQYSFSLPADYDMNIIRQRIESKGYMMDDYPHLCFKAFQFACLGEHAHGSKENLYAPFYLWQHPEGLNNFLTGNGFAALVASFGWPSVRTWFVWHAHMQPKLKEARWATRELIALVPHEDLATRRQAEHDLSVSALALPEVLASLAAFEPSTWSVVHYRLWRELPSEIAAQTQVYEIGHVSAPEIAHD
jgi:hypothetical protein